MSLITKIYQTLRSSTTSKIQGFNLTRVAKVCSCPSAKFKLPNALINPQSISNHIQFRNTLIQSRSVCTTIKKHAKYTDEELETILTEIEKDFGLTTPKTASDQPQQASAEDWQTLGQDDEEIEEYDELRGFSRQRGKTGVFDLEELIQLLRQENLQDICVIAVPPSIQYVDYMVITTGRSARQLQAVAEFVRKVYKRRINLNEFVPNVEGKKSSDWVALDLGNMALHIFTPKARQLYDLETLWAVGPQYDDVDREAVAATQLLAQYSTPVTYGQQHIVTT